MRKKNEIESIKRKILPVLKKQKVTKAGIFGSYARGEQTAKSDVDILVEINQNIGLIGLISLKMRIENAIKKKIDLVEYESIREELKEVILSEEIPILR